MTITQEQLNRREVKSIIVVGGGSSGWMTACLLNARLNNNQKSGAIKITLVEAPDIAPIGVGEATVPSIRRTLQAIGLTERDFMRGSDATFKSLIRFENWNKGTDFDHSFDHPFDRRERPQTDDAVSDWLSKTGGDSAGFSVKFSILSNISTRFLAPKALDWPAYQSTFPYAYHLDAAKLAGVLNKFGTARGIAHELARIERVEQTPDGDIAEIVAADGRKFNADLYIDCTGFSARLAGQIMPETRDYSNHLLCDRAVTLSVPYEVYRPDNILPYTSANARAAGWIWDINLQSRRSLGYVYSSAHISSEEAEAELRRVEGPHANAIEAGHIRFKTYKRKQAWQGNCIAIGLADGFVEPLESTGLYMMQFAAQSVADLLRANPVYSPDTSAQFNRLTQTLFDEVLGYVALHYLTSKRRDTAFWRDATAAERVPDSLKYLMAEWRRRPVHDMDLLSNHRLFSLESYEYLLFGMGYLSDYRAGQSELQGEVGFSLQEQLEKCYAKFPKHEDWLA